ncbi:TIGR00282 family metallophosphoesterase [Macrococcus hajekii]|uniref:TIGR00282 family metallophosphoesterase n=1 Tax=Macrococcus hajekii TaxID=198482 RepID=A0A4R6BMR5_9STAP|nr:TIGR00282 family metallophosphoesterase [Macrococcus hajekii]TDM03134.1 TIGR00282 family metallophosphoesterase [Macrococcus hajekii]GGA96229.1 metallophosphoesterase [Macrococcus hajekii]
MRILFIGDIVGSIGRDMLAEYLPQLKLKYHPNFTIVNGENAAHGRGITEKIYKSFMTQGVDFVTLGNHTYGQREVYDFLDEDIKMIRPANYPAEAPGAGMKIVRFNQDKLAVINLQGRAFMPTIDCPFKKADELIAEARKETPYIFVDFHAETTSEKGAMGYYLDGRVSAVVGTHTHIQTADERVLPQGTGFITDVGMTGYYDGILGINKDEVIHRFLTSMPVKHIVNEQGRGTLSGVFIELTKEGKTKKIERILINGDHPFIGH